MGHGDDLQVGGVARGDGAIAPARFELAGDLERPLQPPGLARLQLDRRRQRSGHDRRLVLLFLFLGFVGGVHVHVDHRGRRGHERLTPEQAVEERRPLSVELEWHRPDLADRQWDVAGVGGQHRRRAGGACDAVDDDGRRRQREVDLLDHLDDRGHGLATDVELDRKAARGRRRVEAGVQAHAPRRARGDDRSGWVGEVHDVRSVGGRGRRQGDHRSAPVVGHVDLAAEPFGSAAQDDRAALVRRGDAQQLTGLGGHLYPVSLIRSLPSLESGCGDRWWPPCSCGAWPWGRSIVIRFGGASTAPQTTDGPPGRSATIV